jgi:hypothetical protein
VQESRGVKEQEECMKGSAKWLHAAALHGLVYLMTESSFKVDAASS